MFCLNIRNISIITVNGVGYCCIIDNISQSDAVHLVVNSVFDDRGYIYNLCQRNQY